MLDLLGGQTGEVVTVSGSTAQEEGPGHNVVELRTDYLILGERPGNKLVKALALGITVLSEQEFERMNS